MQPDLQSPTDAAAAGPGGGRAAARAHPAGRARVRAAACGARPCARESSSDPVRSVCREILEHAERSRYPSEGAFEHLLFTTAQRTLQHRHECWMAQKRGAVGEVPIDSGQGSSSGDVPDPMSRYRRSSSPSRAVRLHEEVERVEAAFEPLSEVITRARLSGLPQPALGG